MKFNHVGFNGAWASTKTVDEFIREQSHVGLTEDELRHAHALIVKKYGDNTGDAKKVSKTRPGVADRPGFGINKATDTKSE